MANKFFYSNEEVKLIKEYISENKFGETDVARLAKKINRTPQAVLQKMYALKRKAGVVSTRRKRGVPEKAHAMPKGMTLEFPASRITLEEGKLVVYF